MLIAATFCADNELLASFILSKITLSEFPAMSDLAPTTFAIETEDKVVSFPDVFLI